MQNIKTKDFIGCFEKNPFFENFREKPLFREISRYFEKPYIKHRFIFFYDISAGFWTFSVLSGGFWFFLLSFEYVLSWDFDKWHRKIINWFAGKVILQTFVTFLQKPQPRKIPAVGFCKVLCRHKTSKAVLCNLWWNRNLILACVQCKVCGCYKLFSQLSDDRGAS